MNIVITGANRGIGLELVRLYRERGERVVALCRKASDQLKSMSVDIVEDIDVASSNSFINLADEIDLPHIDLLINNAGVMRVQALNNFNLKDMKYQFEVNALGPLRVTTALLERMAPQSKIAMITSRMGSIEDNSGGGSYGYRMSKAALNAASKSLAIDLRPRGIAVGIFHPGHVQTDMTGHSGPLTAPEAAMMLCDRIDGLSLENSGQFFHADGSRLPW